MLSLILINVQYLQNVVLSFEKGPSQIPTTQQKNTPGKFPIPQLVNLMENRGQRTKSVKVCLLIPS